MVDVRRRCHNNKFVYNIGRNSYRCQYSCAGTADVCVRANEAATAKSTMSPNTQTATGRAITQFIVYSILIHFKIEFASAHGVFFSSTGSIAGWWTWTYGVFIHKLNTFFSSRASFIRLWGTHSAQMNEGGSNIDSNTTHIVHRLVSFESPSYIRAERVPREGALPPIGGRIGRIAFQISHNLSTHIVGERNASICSGSMLCAEVNGGVKSNVITALEASRNIRSTFSLREDNRCFAVFGRFVWLCLLDVSLLIFARLALLKFASIWGSLSWRFLFDILTPILCSTELYCF